MGWQREYCGEWGAPHCQNSSLSVFLSLHSAALQCFSAHAQTDWERATASLSSLETLTVLHHRHTHVLLCKLCLHLATKVLFNKQVKRASLMTVLKVKMHQQGCTCCHKNQTCDVLFTGLSFVSRSLCLPQAFNTRCSVQNEHSRCSFKIQRHTTSL